MYSSVATVLVLSMLTWPLSAETNNETCPDSENPFNLSKGQYKLPSERIARTVFGWGAYRNPEDMLPMIFKLIPRDSVSCKSNLLPEGQLLSKLNITDTGRTIGVGLECRQYISNWLVKVKKAVLHNLLVVIKAKSVKLFNKYYELKLVHFGANQLVTDKNEGLVNSLQNLRQDLQDGIILPNEEETPTLEYFDEELQQPLEVYQKIRDAASRSRVIIEDCNYEKKDRILCLHKVLSHVLGLSYSYIGVPVAVGYGDYRDRLFDGIDFVRRYFNDHGGYNNLRLPNVKPCFKV